MEQENPFYTRKHCEMKRITNVPDRATARRGGAQLVLSKKNMTTDNVQNCDSYVHSLVLYIGV
jgi:hypothetical protein